MLRCVCSSYSYIFWIVFYLFLYFCSVVDISFYFVQFLSTFFSQFLVSIHFRILLSFIQRHIALTRSQNRSYFHLGYSTPNILNIAHTNIQQIKYYPWLTRTFIVDMTISERFPRGKKTISIQWLNNQCNYKLLWTILTKYLWFDVMICMVCSWSWSQMALLKTPVGQNHWYG